MTYKIKRFNSPSENPMQQEEQQITSRDLQIENMKMQRAMMQNFRAQQKLQADERAARIRQQMQSQRMLQKENELDDKQAQQGTKASQNSKPDPNTGVYKKATIAKAPISMKN